MADLFLNDDGPAPELNGDEPAVSTGAGHVRRGSAAQYLVIADLQIRGIDAGDIGGHHTDIVGDVDGVLRRFQVKGSINVRSFGYKEAFCSGGTRAACVGRSLISYKGKIDAFAFVFLPRRLVYYIHADAISTETLAIADAHWSRHACDLAFDEFLRRLRREPS